tara:strand:+ start:87 stop:509 length:423 start_codon:yes stop_codon:yes gene_type:complete
MPDKLFKDYYNEKTESAFVPGSSKILVQTGTAEPEKIDTSLFEQQKQSSFNSSSTLPASANGIRLFCRPVANIIITIDASGMSNLQENYFLNKAAFTVTFAAAAGTTLVSPQGLVINENGTAFLIKEDSLSEVSLFVSNP